MTGPQLTPDEAEAMRSGYLPSSAVPKVSDAARAFHGVMPAEQGPGLAHRDVHDAAGGGPGKHRTVDGEFAAARHSMLRAEAKQLTDAYPALAEPGAHVTLEWLERTLSILRVVAAGE